jgi:hypothetical protein
MLLKILEHLFIYWVDTWYSIDRKYIRLDFIVLEKDIIKVIKKKFFTSSVFLFYPSGSHFCPWRNILKRVFQNYFALKKNFEMCFPNLNYKNFKNMFWNFYTRIKKNGGKKETRKVRSEHFVKSYTRTYLGFFILQIYCLSVCRKQCGVSSETQFKQWAR